MCLRITIHLILPVLAMAATSCNVSATNVAEMKKEFEDSRSLWNVKVFNFWISGVNWSNSSEDVHEVFDPNWWSWSKEDNHRLLDLPIDNKILSMGLMSIAVQDMNVKIVSEPHGCVDELTLYQQRGAVIQQLLLVTDGEKEEDALLCRCVYANPSLITGNIVGVGRACCPTSALRKIPGCKSNWTVSKEESLHYARKSAAVYIIGTLLPFMLIPCALAWWECHPLSAGTHFAVYLTNKFTKYSHFTIRGQQKRHDQRTLIVKENDLEDYEGSVSLLEVLGWKTRISIAKIKLTLLLLLQYIPMVAWMVAYSNMSDILGRLDSTGKILLNLRNNPISWLWTDRSFCPFYIAVVLVVLNVSVLILLAFWWCLEIEGIRTKIVECLQKRKHPGKKSKWNMPDAEEFVVKHAKRVFIVFFFSIVVGSGLSVYSLCHSIMYTIGGLIVSIDRVSPWLTGGLLLIYYSQRSYSKLVDNYTEIKRITFELCKENKAYKGTHQVTMDGLYENMEKDQLKLKEWKGKEVRMEEVKCEGPVVFYYGHDKNAKDDRMVKIKISKPTLHEICKKLKPVSTGIKNATFELVFTLLFLFLMVFTTAVFRLHAVTGDVSALITSLATLLTALIPRLADMMTTDAEGRLNDDIQKFTIEKLLEVSRPKYHAILDEVTPRPESVDFVLKGQSTYVTLDKAHSGEYTEFEGQHDPLPTLKFDDVEFHAFVNAVRRYSSMIKSNFNGLPEGMCKVPMTTMNGRRGVDTVDQQQTGATSKIKTIVEVNTARGSTGQEEEDSLV